MSPVCAQPLNETEFLVATGAGADTRIELIPNEVGPWGLCASVDGLPTG